MWQKVLISALCLLAVQTQLCQAKGYYTVSGSKVFRANSNYHVSVTSHNADKAAEIEVGIVGDQAGAGPYSNLKTVTVEPDSTKMVELDVGAVSEGSFNLTARGLSGFVFLNETSITLNQKSFSVLIQTDKAIYKPGDTVNFRVVILDSNLKPFALASDVKIFITDAKDNRLKRWTDAQKSMSKNVFTGSLDLSPSTVLGDWTIEVQFLGTTHQKKFEVAEYVLPKFEVTIDTPPLTTFKDEKFKIIVRSKYTYGKPVKGEATISVFPKFYGGYQPFLSQLITRKVVQLDGKASVEFNIKDELNFQEDYQREITIEAVVEEALTGRKQNTTTSMTLYRTKYDLQFTTGASKYKPGLPVEATIKVAYHDGTPLTDANNEVEIFENYRETWEYSATTQTPMSSRKVSLDKNGMARVTLNIPRNTTTIDVHAKYLEVTGYLGYLSKSESKTETYVTLAVNTANPEINEEVSITATSTKGMASLTYLVIGRGDLLIARTIQLNSDKTHTFKFMSSFAMVPRAKLIVYFITDDGEVVSEKANIEFRSQFQNFVKIELSKEKAKPGEDISLTVSTKPNSLVALLGVDQSVNLLKSGNDLNQEDIFKELQSYEEATQFYSPGLGRPIFKRRIAPWYNNHGSFKDFDDSGMVLLTNAQEEENAFRYPVFYSDMVFMRGMPGPPGPAVGMAMPAMATGGGAVFTQPPKIRKEFPETWLFETIVDNGIDGVKTISKKVPDTITSWIITGFAVDPFSGFGMTKMPRKLEVFQPFFVSLNLPYSVKRGEVVAIPIVVFNYMDNDVDAEVTLDNTGQEFDFVDIAEEGSDAPKVELYRRKTIGIKSASGSSLSFMIQPKKVGPITIKVTATSPVAGDGVEMPLLVEPEGVTQFINKAVFVDLSKPFAQSLDVKIPKNAVPDSTKIEVAVMGDPLGSTTKNLDKLIRMPFGCGEQNMLILVPNIVVLDYLTQINALPADLKGKALKNMESGYQRELTYKHKDGSFSAFGESDKSGSVWLTAFVARSFRQAAKYIDVEESVITASLDWLASNQAPNGSFPEVGHVSHKDMQGGAGNGIALTAYVLLAFLENKDAVPQHANTIKKSLEYMVTNLDFLDDPYALSLAAYALQLANHNNKDFALSKLEAKATTDASQKWWNKPLPESEKKNPWYGQPNSVNVEMTAYAMLANLEANQEVFPILKWLIAQRNPEGGFQSTQDTVVGITALAKVGAKMSGGGNKNLNIKAQYGEGVEKSFQVTQDNAMLYQSAELPTSIRQVNVSATGTGFAVVQVSYRYNLNVTGEWQKFVVDPQVNKNSNPDFLHLTVCTSYIPDSASANNSNMAIMEVAFPSGFTADLETIPSLEASSKVKRVETKNGDTVMVIYFDNLDRKERCPTMTAFRTHKVADQKPAAVTVYDYYNNAQKARVFYEAPTATLCDICEGSDCGDKCTVKAESQRSSPEPENYFDKHPEVGRGLDASASAALYSSLGLVVVAFIGRMLL